MVFVDLDILNAFWLNDMYNLTIDLSEHNPIVNWGRDTYITAFFKNQFSSYF